MEWKSKHSVSGVKQNDLFGDSEWSVNNYSSGLTPATASIYVDDAEISTDRLTAQ